MNASQNTIECSIYACGGSTLILSACGDQDCRGDQYLKLFDAESKQVAENDNSCGLCSLVNYTIPAKASCAQFTLRQGCANSAECSGIVRISGGIYQEQTNSPSLFPAGVGWINDGNWSSSLPLKDWYGITMKGANVAQLDLSSNNLQGPLSSTLASLTALEGIQLSNNILTGKVTGYIFPSVR
jgi:hypothetical protein